MKNKFQIKQELYKTCGQHIEERIATIEEKLASIQEARNNETKSSVGDKHNTSRAMMQIEEENSGLQLTQANNVRLSYLKIDPEKQFEKVELGSLVSTTKGNYYIAIGIGRVKIDEQTYYCISIDSPIGSLLKNKRIEDEIEFNEYKIKIIEIV